jgi:4-hydroxybutyrate CoA-transferase
MNWEKHYTDRQITALQATQKIKSGDRIVFGHAVGEPSALIRAIVEQAKNYKDVEIVHMICLGTGDHCHIDVAENFRHNSLFVGGAARKAIMEGRGDYTPCSFSEIPGLFRDGYLPIDIAFLMVSPPDHHGFCSLGVSVDYGMQALKSAKMVIVQVNENMPRTMGDSFVHVSGIDYFVEINEPLIELAKTDLTEVEKQIGRNCAELIEDESTIQLGIGSLPDAVLLSLKDKRDLGIHSEMISDGVVELIEAGVITSKKKTFHNGKIVVTFLMGTKRLYEFANDNPLFHMAPVDYVNDPMIIARNDKMVSLNSCVQVDLMGQIAAESVGSMQISAVGGQADFVRGAGLAKGGKSIIAIQSTAQGGKTSKIVPVLDTETAVTTPRYDVHYVVSEYGIAALKGKTLRERAKALIRIAHPDFRAGLIEHYERKFHTKYEGETNR